MFKCTSAFTINRHTPEKFNQATFVKYGVTLEDHTAIFEFTFNANLTGSFVGYPKKRKRKHMVNLNMMDLISMEKQLSDSKEKV